MTRKLRSILPVELKPNSWADECRQREKQKEYYDRNTKPLPPLSVGDSIRYQEGKTWKQGIVTKEEGDRSYTVDNTEGAVYRRKRRHLMQTNENLEPDIPDVNIACPPNRPVAPPMLANSSQSSLSIPETQFETKQVDAGLPLHYSFWQNSETQVIVSM